MVGWVLIYLLTGQILNLVALSIMVIVSPLCLAMHLLTALYLVTCDHVLVTPRYPSSAIRITHLRVKGPIAVLPCTFVETYLHSFEASLRVSIFFYLEVRGFLFFFKLGFICIDQYGDLGRPRQSLVFLGRLTVLGGTKGSYVGEFQI